MLCINYTNSFITSDCIPEFCYKSGVVDPANLNQLQSTLSNAPTAITSLSNVKVSMFYKKGSSQITLQCQNTGLSQLTINTPQVDSNGNPVTFTDSNGKVVPLYYGFCEVPKTDSNGVNIYHGTCVDLIAEYFSTSGTATGSTRLCDPKANSLSVFQDELNTALLPPSNVFDPKYDAFLLGFIVVGFLFATLLLYRKVAYFDTRSYYSKTTIAKKFSC